MVHTPTQSLQARILPLTLSEYYKADKRAHRSIKLNALREFKKEQQRFPARKT